MHNPPILAALFLSVCLLACGKNEDKTSPIASAAPAISASAALPETAPKDKPLALVFTVKPPFVGEKEDIETHAERHATVHTEINGRIHDSKIDDITTMKVHIETLAVSGDIVTKLKVTYVEFTEGKNGEKPEPSKGGPILGVPYIFTINDGKIEVTDEKGKTSSEAIKKALLDISCGLHLGKRDPIRAALPDKPIQIGDKLDSFATALKAAYAACPSQNAARGYEDFEVKLAAIEGEGQARVAVFSLKWKPSSSSGAQEIWKTTGEYDSSLRIRVSDGRMLERSVTGKFTFTDAKPGGKSHSDGEMKLISRSKY